MPPSICLEARHAQCQCVALPDEAACVVPYSIGSEGRARNAQRVIVHRARAQHSTRAVWTQCPCVGAFNRKPTQTRSAGTIEPDSSTTARSSTSLSQVRHDQMGAGSYSAVHSTLLFLTQFWDWRRRHYSAVQGMGLIFNEIQLYGRAQWRV